MSKLVLVVIVTIFCIGARAQTGFIVLKKRQKSQRFFWKDGHFTFQTTDGQWISGILTKLEKDSFYLTQEIIRYHLMGFDTIHVSGYKFALNDVSAIPRSRETITYENDQVRVELGHERFAWIRNGFLFQVVGGGWVLLNVINDLGRGDPPFAKKNLAGLGIGAAVFVLGTILNKTFDPYIHIGKKYQLELVPISTPRTKTSTHEEK
jgi:hypothetical protein